MAITSEIIGKLGGAEVEVVPVEGAVSGSTGSSKVLTTIDIPAGETWLVAAIGQATGGSNFAGREPWLHLGDIKMPGVISGGASGVAAIASGTISFSINRNTSSGTDSFTGHVYTVKM